MMAGLISKGWSYQRNGVCFRQACMTQGTPSFETLLASKQILHFLEVETDQLRSSSSVLAILQPVPDSNCRWW
jgi:hypothetical protein